MQLVVNFITDGIGNIVRLLGFDDKFIPALPVGLMKTLSGRRLEPFMVDVMHNYGVNSFQRKLPLLCKAQLKLHFIGCLFWKCEYKMPKVQFYLDFGRFHRNNYCDCCSLFFYG